MDDKNIQNDIFSRYLDVCNKVLASNKDRFPYKQILEAVQNQSDTGNIDVEIIEDRPGVTHTIRFHNNKVMQRKPCHCANPTCKKRTWRVTRTYLESVTNNPEEYISNPAKMDWEWIMDSSET